MTEQLAEINESLDTLCEIVQAMREDMSEGLAKIAEVLEKGLAELQNLTYVLAETLAEKREAGK